jgi:hypothetical protein
LAVTVNTTSFNIQKSYLVLTLHLSVEFGSQDTQQLLIYTPFTDWFCITEMKSAYCTVQTESLYKTDICRLKRVKYHTMGKSSLYPLIRRLSEPRDSLDILSPLGIKPWYVSYSSHSFNICVYLPLTYLYSLSITVLQICTCV